MPVDLPPKPSDREMAPNRLFARILNWTAVVVGIGLCWWAIGAPFHIVGVVVTPRQFSYNDLSWVIANSLGFSGPIQRHR
jgi:hypothetical protein